MKRNLITVSYCLLLCVCILFTAYGQQRKTLTTITGYASLYKDSAVVVSLSIANRQKILSAETLTSTTKNGRFSFTVYIDSLSLVTLELNNHRQLGNILYYGILMEPGDSLHVDLPAKPYPRLQEVAISGRSIESVILQQKITKRFSEEPWDRTLPQASLQKRVNRALYFDSLYRDVVARFEPKLSNEVKSAFEAWRLIRYSESAARFFFKENLTDPAIKELYQQYRIRWNENALKKVEKLSLNSDILWHGYAENAMLAYFMKNSLPYDTELTKDTFKLFTIMLEESKGYPFLNNVLSFRLINQAKRYGWTVDIEKLYTMLNGNSSKNLYSKELTALRSILQRGAQPMAYNFKLKDANAKEVSLSDFSGKVVLIDFFFTGCGGCKEITPLMEKLEQQYAGKDIVFVSISVDRYPEQLKQSRGIFYARGSIGLYTNGEAFKHEVIAEYAVPSYPTLSIVGKNGKLLVRDAPDPRTADGKQQLTDLLDLALK